MQQPGPPLEEEAPDWKLEDLVKLALLSEECPHPATPHVSYPAGSYRSDRDDQAPPKQVSHLIVCIEKKC